MTWLGICKAIAMYVTAAFVVAVAIPWAQDPFGTTTAFVAIIALARTFSARHPAGSGQ